MDISFAQGTDTSMLPPKIKKLIRGGWLVSPIRCPHCWGKLLYHPNKTGIHGYFCHAWHSIQPGLYQNTTGCEWIWLPPRQGTPITLIDKDRYTSPPPIPLPDKDRWTYLPYEEDQMDTPAQVIALPDAPHQCPPAPPLHHSTPPKKGVIRKPSKRNYTGPKTTKGSK